MRDVTRFASVGVAVTLIEYLVYRKLGKGERKKEMSRIGSQFVAMDEENQYHIGELKTECKITHTLSIFIPLSLNRIRSRDLKGPRMLQ